jgi:hypothetical protein
MTDLPRKKIKQHIVNGKVVSFTIDGVEQPIPRGLGDKLASVAQPIARAVDKVAGTKIAGCEGCAEMRKRLNAGMTVAEATEIRVIEFTIRKLGKRRKTIFERVDKRLKSKIGKS